MATAVIDNTSLVYLSHLHKSNQNTFNYLRTVFNIIYFPEEVVNEFSAGITNDPTRRWVLEKLKPEYGFYRHCTSYDSIVLAIVKDFREIDKGEAEAYAQLKRVDAHLILSDDEKFRKALQGLDEPSGYTQHFTCFVGLI